MERERKQLDLIQLKYLDFLSLVSKERMDYFFSAENLQSMFIFSCTFSPDSKNQGDSLQIVIPGTDQTISYGLVFPKVIMQFANDFEVEPRKAKMILPPPHLSALREYVVNHPGSTMNIDCTQYTQKDQLMRSPLLLLRERFLDPFAANVPVAEALTAIRMSRSISAAA